MKPQTMFNRVKKHLLKQHEKSFLPGPGNHCAYRGINGLKCAAGILLPDKYYHENMEKFDIVGVMKKSPGLKYYWGSENVPLIQSLQGVHDGSRPEEWEEKLNRVADEYNLKR